MEPAGGGQELVGQFVRLEKAHKIKELAGVLGADVGSLAEQVLRVAHTTDLAVVGLVAVAAIDDDGSHLAAYRLQQILATVLQVKQHLRRWQVVGVLLQVEKLAQHKVMR